MAIDAIYQHSYQIRVYFEDTDTAGIVYYANYLKFAERARTEMLREHDLDHARMMREHCLVFAVRKCVAEYHAPARLDDMLTVRTRVEKVGGASVELTQDIYRSETKLCALTVRLAMLNEDGAPARIPPHLRDGMRGVAAGFV